MSKLLETVSDAEVTPLVPVTPEQELWLDMALASFKSSSATLQDTLQRIATLSSAMCGGLVMFKDAAVSDRWRLAIFVELIFTLAFSVWGMYPKKYEVYLSDAASCRDSEIAAVEHKKYWAILAGGCFALVLLTSLLAFGWACIPNRATSE